MITRPHEPQDLEIAFRRKDFFIVVAVAGDKIIGAVKYLTDRKNNLYIYQLAVLKTYRNRGVGQLLINKIEQIAQTKKCKKILLDCVQEKKLPDYYNKLGFRIDKIEEHRNHHAVYMSKLTKTKNLQ